MRPLRASDSRGAVPPAPNGGYLPICQIARKGRPWTASSTGGSSGIFQPRLTKPARPTMLRRYLANRLMIRSIHRSLFFPSLLVALSSLAEAPSGQINFSFDPAVLPLWDFSGTFQPTNQTIQGAGGSDVPLSLAADLTQAANGRLTGSGLTVVGIGSDFVAANYTASGRVSGDSSKAKMNLTIRLKGDGVVAGRATHFNISVTYKLQVKREAGVLAGTAQGHANLGSLGGGPIKSDVAAPLPPGMNGSWNLQLDVSTLSKISGTGTIFLSNTRTLPGNLTGSYSGSADQSKIKFTGVDAAKGSSLNLTLETHSLGVSRIVKLKGKVLGETLQE